MSDKGAEQIPFSVGDGTYTVQESEKLAQVTMVGGANGKRETVSISEAAIIRDKGAESGRAIVFKCVPIEMTASREHAEMLFSLSDEIDLALAEAHSAGYEAGLKARLPSRQEVRIYLTQIDVGDWADGYNEAIDATYSYMAANMRKGDV